MFVALFATLIVLKIVPRVTTFWNTQLLETEGFSEDYKHRIIVIVKIVCYEKSFVSKYGLKKDATKK